MSTNEQRAAFLAGEGTLTVEQVREWSRELAPYRGLPTPPYGMSPRETLMVSVTSQPDTRGLSGATIVPGFPWAPVVPF
jgi:hypothetical protein